MSQPVRGQPLFLAWFKPAAVVKKGAKTAALLRQPPATALFSSSFKGMGELNVDHASGCVHACTANDDPGVVCIELRRTVAKTTRYKIKPRAQKEIVVDQLMSGGGVFGAGLNMDDPKNPRLPALNDLPAPGGRPAFVLRLKVMGGFRKKAKVEAAETFLAQLRAICDAASANAPSYYPQLSIGDLNALRAEPDAGSSVKSVGVTVGLEYEFSNDVSVSAVPLSDAFFANCADCIAADAAVKTKSAAYEKATKAVNKAKASKKKAAALKALEKQKDNIWKMLDKAKKRQAEAKDEALLAYLRRLPTEIFRSKKSAPAVPELPLVDVTRDACSSTTCQLELIFGPEDLGATLQPAATALNSNDAAEKGRPRAYSQAGPRTRPESPLDAPPPQSRRNSERVAAPFAPFADALAFKLAFYEAVQAAEPYWPPKGAPATGIKKKAYEPFKKLDDNKQQLVQVGAHVLKKMTYVMDILGTGPKGKVAQLAGDSPWADTLDVVHVFLIKTQSNAEIGDAKYGELLPPMPPATPQVNRGVKIKDMLASLRTLGELRQLAVWPKYDDKPRSQRQAPLIEVELTKQQAEQREILKTMLTENKVFSGLDMQEFDRATRDIAKHTAANLHTFCTAALDKLTGAAVQTPCLSPLAEGAFAIFAFGVNHWLACAADATYPPKSAYRPQRRSPLGADLLDLQDCAAADRVFGTCACDFGVSLMPGRKKNRWGWLPKVAPRTVFALEGMPDLVKAGVNGASIFWPSAQEGINRKPAQERRDAMRRRDAVVDDFIKTVMWPGAARPCPAAGCSDEAKDALQARARNIIEAAFDATFGPASNAASRWMLAPKPLPVMAIGNDPAIVVEERAHAIAFATEPMGKGFLFPEPARACLDALADVSSHLGGAACWSSPLTHTPPAPAATGVRGAGPASWQAFALTLLGEIDKTDAMPDYCACPSETLPSVVLKKPVAGAGAHNANVDVKTAVYCSKFDNGGSTILTVTARKEAIKQLGPNKAIVPADVAAATDALYRQFDSQQQQT